MLFSFCWQGLRAGFHFSRLIYTVPGAEPKPCFTISCKSSEAIVLSCLHTPHRALAVYAQGWGRSPELLCSTPCKPPHPGCAPLTHSHLPWDFSVSLSPAQILLKTLPLHFPRDAQLIFSCPLRGASGVCGWAGAGRALLTGSDYPAAPRGGGGREATA